MEIVNGNLIFALLCDALQFLQSKQGLSQKARKSLKWKSIDKNPSRTIPGCKTSNFYSEIDRSIKVIRLFRFFL